ncbi:cyclic nucleotide-binding domain-containing protein [Candidatus Reidiella endopervernicosa]|uniref:Cyclic nucleotide-binding domain-containing protein n=1 Tax=Candidatus Reidiella endopervernicosa TaxID=2738883 RepID=A0A6N0HTY8_9GAMM|nr:cyclic nucleotide-binding domain-containing protein [Candidatus Reidiella endopervernicosa]QKQ25874.1 cyclic nucleotide-binding domain-containing protein [Candidatus Reidiella endopervernicosa]
MAVSAGEAPVELVQLGEGASFGEEALISDNPRNANVVMVTDGTLLRLNKQNFVELLKEPMLNWLSFGDLLEELSGSRYFAEACFGHPSPSKRQILNATVYAYGAPTSCVRCVITSSRLYTTPSVTLRRHKAAAASSPSFAHASTTNRQTASTIGD